MATRSVAAADSDNKKKVDWKSNRWCERGLELRNNFILNKQPLKWRVDNNNDDDDDDDIFETETSRLDAFFQDYEITREKTMARWKKEKVVDKGIAISEEKQGTETAADLFSEPLKNQDGWKLDEVTAEELEEESRMKKVSHDDLVKDFLK